MENIMNRRLKAVYTLDTSSDLCEQTDLSERIDAYFQLSENRDELKKAMDKFMMKKTKAKTKKIPKRNTFYMNKKDSSIWLVSDDSIDCIIEDDDDSVTLYESSTNEDNCISLKDFYNDYIEYDNIKTLIHIPVHRLTEEEKKILLTRLLTKFLKSKYIQDLDDEYVTTWLKFVKTQFDELSGEDFFGTEGWKHLF